MCCDSATRDGQSTVIDPAQVNAIREAYHLRGWKHVVSSTSAGGPVHDQTTDVWLVMDGANVRGAVVLVESPKSLTLATLAGNLSPVDLLHLRGHFGIPRFEGDGLTGDEPVNSGSGAAIEPGSRAPRHCHSQLRMIASTLDHSRKGLPKQLMQSTYNGLELPKNGQPIDYKNGQFAVPDHPIIPFIEGDGTGRDIWKASQRVFDAAVEKAYGGKRAIRWFEIFAGEKAFRQFNTWLPDDSVAAARDLRVSIKGPLTTPVGGGIRSLNVALRQILDLYACVRPVKYYQGVPSPVKHPEKLDIVIFRENTEDVYAGIEFKQGSEDAARLIAFLNDDLLQGRQEKGARRFGRWHQAHLHLRHQAAGALRHPQRDGDGPQNGHARPQGQHPEVH